MTAISSEHDIQGAYRDETVARDYVADRFASQLNSLLHDRQVAVVNSIFERFAPTRALEIAPGPGRLTRDVRPTGELVCLEFNEGMIHEGRRACRNGAHWVRGNAFRLPFQRTFDFVYSFRFIRHFHSPDRRRLYDQITRLLNPGGYVVFDAVNRAVSEPLRNAYPRNYPIYDKLYDEMELRGELADVGLEMVGIEQVQRNFRLQYKSQILLGPRADWLNRLVIRGLEKFSAGNCLEWIVTCRRE